MKPPLSNVMIFRFFLNMHCWSHSKVFVNILWYQGDRLSYLSWDLFNRHNESLDLYQCESRRLTLVLDELPYDTHCSSTPKKGNYHIQLYLSFKVDSKEEGTWLRYFTNPDLLQVSNVLYHQQTSDKIS